jgi:hypothetical protein
MLRRKRRKGQEEIKCVDLLLGFVVSPSHLFSISLIFLSSYNCMYIIS